MADQKIYKLISGLYNKTRSGEVKWSRSVDREFLASFNNYSVGVSEDDNRKTGFRDIHLRIYNFEGELIESAVDSDFTGDPNTVKAVSMLASIYEQARRMALGVDTALDTLLMELGA